MVTIHHISETFEGTYSVCTDLVVTLRRLFGLDVYMMMKDVLTLYLRW